MRVESVSPWHKCRGLRFCRTEVLRLFFSFQRKVAHMIAKAGPQGIPAFANGQPGAGQAQRFGFTGSSLIAEDELTAFNLNRDPVPPDT